MKMPAFAVAAGLVVASLGFGTAVEAAPPHHDRHYDRGHDRGHHRGWDRHDRRGDRRYHNRRYRGQHAYGYGARRCWVEWHRGNRVRVCR